MKMQINRTYIISALLVTVAIFGTGLSASAQSVYESRPTVIRSNKLTGTVSGKKVYYYSLRARRGTVVTVNLKAAWTRGASMSLRFSGMRGNDGAIKPCCSGDNYFSIDHGSRSSKEIEKSFTVSTDEPFLMAFSFNTPNLAYTITFNGISLTEMAEETGTNSEFVTVPGNSGNNWVNSGIRVRKGDVITLDAAGKVDVGAGWGVHGPEGTTNFYALPGYPVSSRTRYGLSAKIVPNLGSLTQEWSYGDTKRIVVIRDGVLWLTVNDDNPANNTGEFRVSVSVRRKDQK